MAAAEILTFHRLGGPAEVEGEAHALEDFEIAFLGPHTIILSRFHPVVSGHFPEFLLRPIGQRCGAAPGPGVDLYGPLEQIHSQFSPT